MAHPRTLLLELQANARKSLSQNFLTSPHWAECLAGLAAEAPGAEAVWEIGPGLGALTEVLLTKTQLPVTLFEYDRKLSARLRTVFPHVPLVEGDFLKAHTAEYSSGKKISVLSNLPYHLSSPIFFKLLEEKPRLVRMVLTFQREFAERLIAVPRTKAYGALSVIAQLHFRIESVGVLPPGAFYPAPGVSSEALKFEPIAVDGQAADVFSRVVKASFQQRRKTLSNNLRRGFPSVAVDELMERVGLEPSVRPEELTKEQYMQLSQSFRPGEGLDLRNLPGRVT